MNVVKHEPVLTATLIVPVIVFAATRFGLSMTTGEAGSIAAVLLAIGAVIARQAVTPTSKLP